MNAFEKIKETFANIHRVVETDEDLEWNRAVYKCETIVSEVEAEYAIHTNADYIRSLSDGELAHFLMDFKNTIGLAHENEMSCLDWLKGVLW